MKLICTEKMEMLITPKFKNRLEIWDDKFINNGLRSRIWSLP